MMQTQKVPPVFETNVASNITIVADQEAFFADAATPTHPPHRWIQAKPRSLARACTERSISASGDISVTTIPPARGLRTALLLRCR